MPQPTGNAPPPDGNGRTASDQEITSLGELDRTMLPGATATDDVSSAAGQEGPLTVGQPFGPRYRINRVLGVGGMGAVYEAWDSELGVAVAVKVIRPEIAAADPKAAGEIERRFKRELLLARQVTHPNIIRIHDLGDIDGIKYITMPFIEGADLATILKKDKTLDVDRALRISRGVVAGLVSAHHAGVIHRDLKPANIMIGPHDVPTIMDFGIARSAGGPGQSGAPARLGVRPADLSRTAALAASSTMAGAIVGTVAYMAPEQARGEAVDQRADIYAFGLILYDMLIGGRRSERAVSAVAELKERMVTAPPAPRTIDPTIPEGVDAIIRRCLEPDAANRFATSAELQAAFDRLDSHGKPLPIARRVSGRTLLTAAVVVLAALGSTFYVTRWFSAPVVEPDPVSVLIADLQNETNDPTFTGTLEPMLTRALEGAAFISAYDRNRVRTGLGVVPPQTFDETAARELAVKQGVGIVLAGSVSRRGNGYEVQLKAMHAVTGDVITTARQRASTKEEVLTAAMDVSGDVREALGDSKSESSQLFAGRSVSANSLDVIGHYAAAMQAQSNLKFEEARDSYAKAVALDPQFGLGYQGLAVMSRNLGRIEEAEKYIKEALRYLDSMTDRERFGTRGFYYRMIGDNQQCAKEYEQLVQLYPADTVGHAQRSVCLAAMKNMREAVSEGQRAVDMMPNHVGYRTNLALLKNFAGDFAAAEGEVKAIAHPGVPALVAVAYSQLARGMIAESAATYRRIAEMPGTGASTAAAGLADIAIYQGHYTEALAILDKAVERDVAEKSMSRASIKLTTIGMVHAMRGAKASAIASADQALAYSKTMPVRFLAARVYVEAGAFDKAEALASGLTAELPASPQAHGKIVLGEIALQKGDAREAIRILTEANGLVDTWFGRLALGRAYLEAGAFPQADSEFDRCISRRGEALSLMDEGATYGYFPPVYYYQGRVREQLGTAGFVDSYREYLRIRGSSTEDPLLREVRRRIGN
jgi:serine/threonine protein kinase/tetratricopeptide (TPR) repeat protein